MNSPSPNERALAAVHESLGNEYLDTMHAYGVQVCPVVGWTTRVDVPGCETRARIFWSEGEDEEEVFGFPRDMLVGEVVRRVLLRLGSGN